MRNTVSSIFENSGEAACDTVDHAFIFLKFEHLEVLLLVT
jgi:hypothetical protein